MWPNRYFGTYWGDRYWMNNGAIIILGTQLFIATQGASGDTYSQSGSGDTYTQGANDDDFTQGGGIA